MNDQDNDRLRYRLGLDIGSTSIGWAVLRLDRNDAPDYLVRLGVRLFSSGRSPIEGTSLAADRRAKRQQRRRRDRLIRRKRLLIRALSQYGLWPTSVEERKALQKRNPYELRARALREALSHHELGRAIFHLNQRRGFKSNRKDLTRDADAGVIKGSIAALGEKLRERNIETVGAYLHERLQGGLGTRSRRFGQGTKAEYEFYIDRAMISDEFDRIWDRQLEFGVALQAAAREEIRRVLFYQRPLRPVDPGRCSLEPNERRAAEALPSCQLFRIQQEVNHLRLRLPGETIERPLTSDERLALIRRLMESRKLTFDQIRKLLKLPDAIFNLQSDRRAELKGNLTAAVLGHKDLFGKEWHAMPIGAQDATVAILIDDSLSDDEAVERLKGTTKHSDETLKKVLAAKLPTGYFRLSSKAIARINPHLASGLTYDKAVRAAGYATTDSSLDGSLTRLPYYGIVLQRHVGFGTGSIEDCDEQRYGRISNPSVHIALNQLRKLINALIEKYGKPDEISLELARDLKVGWNRAKEIEREQAKRQDENDRLREELDRLGHEATHENLLRLRLFRELSHSSGMATQCVYTGEQISPTSLFSPEVQIDHILPYSRTLDDSIANKVLCKQRANRHKGNLTPHEAFGHSPDGYSWEAILLRAATLPRRRAWRFDADAMVRFETDNGFLARQLSDTAYMSRVAREYLTAICPPSHIWVVNGALTAMLRHKWGLNRLLSRNGMKNRLDHRHHAIDALVIGCIDRRTVQKVSAAAHHAKEHGHERLVEHISPPWSSFLAGATNAVRRVVVSHRPDHNPLGPLHNETAYGAIDDTAIREQTSDQTPRRHLVRRYIPLLNLVGKKPRDIRKHVVDQNHASRLHDIALNSQDKHHFSIALEKYSRDFNVRRIRWKETLTVVPIFDRSTREAYKYFKGDSNYCYEIFEEPSGRLAGDLIDRFTANQRPYREFMRDKVRYRATTFRGQRLHMRLSVNDMVAIGEGDSRRIYRLQKMTRGTITLVYHAVAGDPSSDKCLIPDIKPVIRVAPSRLQGLKARRVFVDILGYVKDPGSHYARANRGGSGG